MKLELVDHDRLGEIVQQVNDEYALMTGDMSRAVQRAIRIGEMLTEAKAEVAHGEWIPWVDRNLAFGDSMAAKYMRLYRNRERVPDLAAGSLREAVALLAEPREEPPVTAEIGHTAPAPAEPDIAPVLDDEPDTEPEYRNDPALERGLAEARRDAKFLENHIAANKRAIEAKEIELSTLRKLKADKERVEKALRDLNELEKRKQEAFRDSESLDLAMSVLRKSREFFTRECMQIPALKFRPGTTAAIRDDMEGLIELVENWTAAMRAKFMED